MADSYFRQSPLAHLHLDARAISIPKQSSEQNFISEIRFRDMLSLRGNKKDPNFTSAIQKITRCSLPEELNTASRATSDLTIFALGPDEWLIVTISGNGNKLKNKLRKQLEQQHASVTPVGESRTIIRLTGRNIRDILAKGCTIDLHPNSFGPGQCAQTLLARTDILLHCIESNPLNADVFDIYVNRSYAEYAWNWVEDAGREYKIVVKLA